MKYLTNVQIADLCDDLDGKANRKAINKLFREQDESHLFPINGEFNATDRAIRHIRPFIAEYDTTGLEYAYMLDSEISNIVNNP